MVLRISIQFLVFLLMSIELLSQTPQFQWVQQVGSNQAFGGISVMGLDVTSDNEGNVYSAGIFNGTVDFDTGPDTFNLVSNGCLDIFLQKFDANGNFLWVKQFGGDNCDAGGSPAPIGGIRSTGLSITTDEEGNVFIAGTFNGNSIGNDTADFDPSPSIFNIVSNGESDVFVVKLNGDGEFAWAKGIGGIYNDNGWSINVDQSGNVLMTGGFRDTVDFNPSPIQEDILISNGLQDVFILKLNPAGEFVWMKQVGGIGAEHGRWVISNLSNDVIVSGGFADTVDFNPAIGQAHQLSQIDVDQDMFVLKLDSNGVFNWVEQLDVYSLNYNVPYYGSIATDENQFIYVTGLFGDSIDFDPSPVDSFILAGGGTFIQKLDTDGNFIDAINIENAFCYTISSESNGRLDLVGGFIDTVDFNPSPTEIFMLVVNENSDNAIFILSLDTLFNFIWAGQMSGINNTHKGVFGASDDSGNIYVSGFFRGTMDFNPLAADTLNLTVIGVRDAFTLKLSMDGLVGFNQYELEQSNISIYPNPNSGRFTVEWSDGLKPETVSVLALDGKVVKEYRIDQDSNTLQLELKGSPGSYYIKLTNQTSTLVAKVILQ